MGYLAAAGDRTWRFHLRISSDQSLKYLLFVQELCGNPIEEFLVVVLLVVVLISLADYITGLLPMQANYSSNGMGSPLPNFLAGSPETFLEMTKCACRMRIAPTFR